MKKILIAIILGLSLASCSPQMRLNRLITRHPELITATDTITLADTVVPELFTLDTLTTLPFVINSDSTADTPCDVYLRFDGGWFRISRQLGESLYRLQLQIQPDPIITNNQVKIPRFNVEYIDKPLKWHQKFFIKYGIFSFCLSILSIGILIYTRIFKKFKI